MEPRLRGVCIFFISCVFLYPPPAQCAETLRDRVAEWFGIHFRTLDEKESERFHQRLDEGDVDGALKVLQVYLRKAKKEYEKEGSPKPPVQPGRSSTFVPPWDRFLERAIRDTKDDNILVLFDVLGKLFNDENKGGGYHLSGLVEMSGKKLSRRYGNNPRSFFAKLLDEYETLSPEGKGLLAVSLLIDLQENKGFAYINQGKQKVDENEVYDLISDVLSLSWLIRNSRDRFHHLEPDSTLWPLEEYDEMIMKVIGRKEIPVMIRASAANKLLFESGGLINCPRFARELYELNAELEADYTTPPVRWWRFHLHNQTTRRCGDKEIAEMAAVHVLDWFNRAKAPAPPGFPEAILGSNMLGEALEILSMADRDSEARELAAEFVTAHHRLDPDIFLVLVEIGDLDRALTMLPGKGEKLIPWRGESLRPKLIERLPEFYEAMDDPALQLQIEAGVHGLMWDAYGDFRPAKRGLLDRKDLIKPLYQHLNKLDIEDRVVLMGGMLKNPSMVSTYADLFESWKLDYPLLELYGGAIPGDTAFYHRTNCWNTRLMAAYHNEDWQLCREICNDLLELEKSGFRKDCGGLVSKLIGRMNSLVIDQLISDGEHDFEGAAQFWKELCINITPMTNVTDWTSRGRALAFSRMLLVKAGKPQTFEEWLADFPPPKARMFSKVRQTAPGYAIFLAVISNDPRWSQGPDHGRAYKHGAMRKYYSNPAFLEQEYGDYNNLKEYCKRCFTEADVESFIADESLPVDLRVFWIAALGQFHREDKDAAEERIALFQKTMEVLPIDAKHDISRELMILSIADVEWRRENKDEARAWLDKLGEVVVYKDWVEDIEKRQPKVTKP